MNSFQSLEKPHEEVHLYGKKAVQAKFDGDSGLAFQYLEQMESAADVVISGLEASSRVKSFANSNVIV